MQAQSGTQNKKRTKRAYFFSILQMASLSWIDRRPFFFCWSAVALAVVEVLQDDEETDEEKATLFCDKHEVAVVTTDSEEEEEKEEGLLSLHAAVLTLVVAEESKSGRLRMELVSVSSTEISFSSYAVGEEVNDKDIWEFDFLCLTCCACCCCCCDCWVFTRELALEEDWMQGSDWKDEEAAAGEEENNEADNAINEETGSAYNETGFSLVAYQR